MVRRPTEQCLSLAYEGRIRSLDIAKGMGLILVVFGHLFSYGGKISNAIFSFHMPLFFFISGLLSNYQKSEGLSDYIKKKVKGLLVPYAIFCIIGALVDLIVPSWRSCLGWTTLWEVLYLAGPESLHVGQIWFLICLFWVELAGYFIDRFCRNDPWLTLLILLASFCLGSNIQFINQLLSIFPFNRLPLKLDSALMAIPLFYIGHLLRGSYDSTSIQRSGRSISLCAAAALYIADLAASLYLLGPVNISSISYSNPATYLFCGISGTIATLLLANSMQGCPFLETLGRHSLVLFSLHSFGIEAVDFVAFRLIGAQVKHGQNLPYSVIVLGGSAIVAALVIIGFALDARTNKKENHVRKSDTSYS